MVTVALLRNTATVEVFMGYAGAVCLTVPARADRQAPGGLVAVVLWIVLWLMDR